METSRFRVVVFIPTVYLISFTKSYMGKKRKKGLLLSCYVHKCLFLNAPPFEGHSENNCSVLTCTPFQVGLQLYVSFEMPHRLGISSVIPWCGLQISYGTAICKLYHYCLVLLVVSCTVTFRLNSVSLHQPLCSSVCE